MKLIKDEWVNSAWKRLIIYPPVGLLIGLGIGSFLGGLSVITNHYDRMWIGAPFLSPMRKTQPDCTWINNQWDNALSLVQAPMLMCFALGFLMAFMPDSKSKLLV